MTSVITEENNQLKDIEQFKQNLVAVPAIDLIPVYASPVEREIFNLFFTLLTDLTAKYIEKTIQTAYIFDRIESKIIPQEKEGKINVFLKEFISLFRRYNRFGSIDKSAAKEIRLKYFSPDENTSAEAKRLKLVTEINKIVDKEYKIPSHSLIKSSLLNLETQRYLDTKKAGARTLWHLNPEFYQHWQDRRSQLMRDLEQRQKESNKAFSSGKKLDAMIGIVNNYPRIVLEFYGIPYWNILKGNVSNKKFWEPVSLIYKYLDDINILTRY